MQQQWSAASVICLMALVFPLASLAQSTSFRRPDRTDSPDHRKILLGNTVTAVHFFHVLDGKNLKTAISWNRLTEVRPCVIDGYITGIIVYCDEEMAVELDGRRFSELLKNPDGGFSAEYFGRLDDGPVSSFKGDNAYFEKPDVAPPEKPNEKAIPGGYSVFSPITGNAVSTHRTFQLVFESEDERIEIPVHQKGFQNASWEIGDLPFRTEVSYIGTRLERLRSEIPDFDERLAAIRRGIFSVEKGLDIQLISRAVILDYAAIQNAVTFETSDDIWFYIETFREEPLSELETIAAHETLHKYVDLREWTRSHSIRKMFSNLKGHDLFSMERFLMVTRGITPKNEKPSDTENGRFFAFIDERNFLEDRKGGHSRDNLDEFCTSFIHAALNIERLEKNLNRRIDLRNHLSRRLNGPEKAALLRLFLENLNIFHETLLAYGEQAESEVSHLEIALFEEGLALARQIHTGLNEMLTSTTRVPSVPE